MSTTGPISLKPFNTFHIDESARECIEIHRREDILQLQATRNQEPWYILGGGSNVLLTQPVDGLVVFNRLQGITCIREDETHVWIQAASGVIWHDLVMWCVERGYGGIENLALIPGTCGAAPIQNIGAYGVELTAVFHELEALDIQGGNIRLFSREDCRFGYRDSVFKQEAKGLYFIVSITLCLSKTPRVNTSYGGLLQVLQERGIAHPGIRDVADAVIAIRQSKLPDPAATGNAGSFFKNPVVLNELAESLKRTYPDMPLFDAAQGVKIPAAWLIEQCGWKGYRSGDAGVHPKQALVLVNYGNAKGEAIFRLSEEIITSVQQRFNILLEREVNIW